MKTFRILWFFGASMPNDSENLKLLVNGIGYDNDVLVCGKHQKKVYRDLGVFRNVYNLMEDFTNSYKHITSDIESRITPDIKKHVYEYVEYDRKLRARPIEFINKAILHHYAFVERIISENKYNFFYGEVGHLITCLLLDIGKRYGVKILWPMMSFWPNRFFLSTGGKHALQKEIAKSYKYVKENGITEEEKKWAASYIDEFRNSTPKTANVECVESGNSKPTNSILPRNFNIIRKARRAIELSINHNSYYKNDYYGATMGDILKGYLKPFIPNRYKYSIARYEKPVKGEKYILFYLHYEPDLSTLVWAPYYKNQALFLKNLAFSIPYGYRLYVKEHPLMQNRPKGLYEEIGRIPQVRLLASKEPHRALLTNCDLVLTITGTIGWEALLLGKPTIVFGNVFYNCFKGTIVLRDWEKLPGTITELLNKKSIFTDEELIRLVVAVKRFAVPGDWHAFTLPRYNKENTEQLCESFRRKMLLESKK